MAATLMQLRRLVRNRIGVPISDDFMPDRAIDDAINMAVQTVDAEQHWPWCDAAQTATIDAATPDIAPPDDWRASRAVMFGEEELGYLSPIDVLTWMDTRGDVPKVWSPINEVIVVRPVVNTPVVVRHLYYRQSAWLREDEDTPLIPEQYGGAIVAKAAELLATRESSGGDATRHGAEFQAWVARMRRDTRRATGPTRTRVRPGGWI